MINFTKKEYNYLIINQQNEIDGYYVYLYLSKKLKNKKNASILKKIADEEKKHYDILKKYSDKDIKPNKFKVLFYIIISKVLGLTFSLKLLENGEKKADIDYSSLKKKIKEISLILDEEDRHEKELINMINESRLNYVGSIVLGLNDALVELTGALAGYTFAIQNNRIIAMIGLITGISASLSMASSEFLSKRHENETKDAFKSSLYTGIAYIITVILLILPFILFKNYFMDLAITIAIAILIILFFNFYISTAKDLSFKKRFIEMALISISVATVSFGIGYIIKIIFKIEI
ncbi:MAG: VIT1/CCC1 transporter family protein [Spirochaetes bacterium]|nr:VIT1/CCC1 transporter family protein [Spirochaetota bacterium]